MDYSSTSQSLPAAVLMGMMGAGKTSLLNSICQKNFLTGEGEACTMNIYLSGNKIGEDAFELFDTPGHDSDTEPRLVAHQLRAALTTKPINAIFIIVKYDARTPRLMANFQTSLTCVQGFKEMVVAMISHWDHCKDKTKMREMITAGLKDLGISQKIFFTNESKDKNEIANKMFAYMNRLPPRQLEISDKEFALHFNHVRTYQQIDKEYERFKIKMNSLYTSFNDGLKLIDTIDSNDKIDFLHGMLVSFKRELHTRSQEAQEIEQKRMTQEEFLWYCTLKLQDIQQAEESFTRIVSMKLGFNLKDPKNPKNRCKKCPNCGLYWEKVSGCDGKTNCGAMPDDVHDIANPTTNTSPLQAMTKFIFTVGKMGLQYVKTAFAPPRYEDQGRRNSTGERRGVGCGYEFIWSELPLLTDEELNRYLSISSREQVQHFVDSNLPGLIASEERDFQDRMTIRTE